MFRRLYDPGIYAQLPPVVVQAGHKDAFPPLISRLGKDKTEFMVRELAKFPSDARVLEVWAGSGLGSALIAQRLGNPHVLVCHDPHYCHYGNNWQYAETENYFAACNYYGVKDRRTPLWLGMGMDGFHIPQSSNTFDVAFAFYSPRTSWDRHEDMRLKVGTEYEITPEEQRHHFEDVVYEVHRVLRSKGRFYATSPLTWVGAFGYFASKEVVRGNASPVKFANCKDPLVYVVAEK